MTIKFDHIHVTNELDNVILMRLYIQKHRWGQCLHKTKIVLINIIIAYKSIICLRLWHEQVKQWLLQNAHSLGREST